MVPYAPITSTHVAEGSMSVRDLCAAAATVSDNAAANILLQPLGGPAALTQFLGDIGDPDTRLDRPQRRRQRPADRVAAGPLSRDRRGLYE